MALSYQKFATNSFLLRLSFLRTLPAAFFVGLRIKEFTDEKVVSSIKYSWFTRNPFRFIYFACMSMAAEISTGLLLLNYTQRAGIPISTLVVKNQSSYYKKAVGKILFTCIDGGMIKEKVEYAVSSGEPVLVETRSVGKDEQGDVVAEYSFTWSIKAKKKIKQ